MLSKKDQGDPERAAFDNGIDEGRRQMKAEVLTLLEGYYLADDAPPRSSAKGEAILQLTRDVAKIER